MEKLEIKILVYLIIMVFILRILAKYVCNKQGWDWNWYKKEAMLSVIGYLLQYLLIGYLLVRIVIYPLSKWFFSL